MSITLIDATASSLSVSWPEREGSAVKYILEYRIATSSDEEKFQTLSNKLTSTQARKKNLSDPDQTGFFFRVGVVPTESSDGNDKDNDVLSPTSWMSHQDPFYLLSEEEEKRRIAAPRVVNAGSNETGLVAWDTVHGKDDDSGGYELQMRENRGGCEWKTIAPSLSGTEVRKKNLTSSMGYQFRVRLVGSSSSTGRATIFSPPSDPFVALGLSNGLRRVFNALENGSLLRTSNEKPAPLADVLGGKEFVLLYASAHWCGPCRQFTPQLAGWYQSQAIKSVEVVFLSCDHDANGFNSYYSTMPWAAVPFDDDGREQLISFIRVTGIPRLVVLDGKTGRIIENNAVGKPMDINHWRSLASTSK